MKVLEQHNTVEKCFPMIVTCHRVTDEYGFGYGEEKDFCGSVLEVESTDIVKHKWFKYPNYNGEDYGVVCPVCKKFVVVDKNILPKAVVANSKSPILSNLNNIPLLSPFKSTPVFFPNPNLSI